MSLGISSCNLTGAAQPTAVPFAATPYQPGNEAISAAANDSNSAAAGASITNTTTNTLTATNATSAGNTAVAAAPAASDAGQPVAETVAQPTTGALRYSGEIAADHQVVVVAETPGMVLDLPLQVGDMITKGALIAQLDTTLLEAQKAQAMVGLEAATAQLALVKLPPDEDDLAAAQAAVNAAGAAYNRASGGLTAEEQRLVLAQLKQAQAAVTVAQAAYNQVKGNPAIGMLPQSLQLQQATIGVEAAQANYDKAMKGATQDVIAGAYAQLAGARAQLQRLKEGAKPEQIKAVEAQVKQAEMGVYLAQLQVSKATVKAPIDGIISRVNSTVGAMAAPGAPLVTILSHEVKVTVAVEETRISQLAVGQPALIYVDAYPGRAFEGTVAYIAPELDPATRTVQVTIRPNTIVNELAPGMSAAVELFNQ
ncbi:MAG: HlyD family efflux transporter periplasmic adaptor subunit [Caldilinea sp. CFX5]|nr:HlyD family efflux transporter periplasmic adaptor subunit [Caldilinea sp. CFX5]